MNQAGDLVAGGGDALGARHRMDSLYDRLDLGALASLIRRRLRLFFYTAIIVFDLAALLAVWLPSQYSATAIVVLSDPSKKVTPGSSTSADDKARSSADVETQVEIVTSRDLATRVVDYLHLESDADMQAMVRPKPGFFAELMGAKPEGRDRPLTAEQRAKLRQAIVGRVMGGLSVDRVATAYALSITFTDQNPTRAAAIANAVAQLFTEGQVTAKQRENALAVKLLGERTAVLKAQAQEDFNVLQQYRISNNLLSTSGQSLTEQEISAYNREVTSARAQSVEDQARLNTALSQLKASLSGEFGEALNSPVTQSLRLKRADLTARLAEVGGSLGPRNPDYLEIKNQLADVDQQLTAEIGRIIAGLRAQSQISGERLRSLTGSLGNAQGTLAQNNRAMVGLGDLQRRAEASQALYESYLNRYKEAVADSGAERPDSRLVTEARVPGAASFPNRTLFLILGVLLGTGAGLVAALVAELSFTGLTTGEDVRKRIGADYLGGLPELKSIGVRNREPLEELKASPRGAFAEAIRGILAKLRQRRAKDAPGRVLLVSSALPHEGKTTMTSCLAASAARAGDRVIVLDCDAIRREFTRKFGETGDIAKTPGLAQVLSGDVTIASAIAASPDLGCAIIAMRPFGEEADARIDPVRMADLIAHLRQHYQMILLDSAPVLPVAETRELAALADDILLVARWRETPEKALVSAIELLPEPVQSAVGVALTMIDMKKHSRFARGDAAAFYATYKGYYHA